MIPSSGWFSSWANCFKGSLWDSKSNLRRTILGTSLQMMQQWTGVNFIFYYSTPFLQSTGAIDNTFLISLIFTLVNVCSTPISFYTVEKFGRRPLLIWGALGMLICQFLVAIIGVTVGFNHTHPDPNDADASLADNISAVNAQIAFIAIFIFFFASTWGPGAWIVIGEIFPLPIRSRGVGLSTASNWLWNTVRSPSLILYNTNKILDYRRHHPLHGRRRQGKFAVIRLLHLGRSLHLRLRLLLLPRSRDQGLDP
jgi:MFS family permease